MANFTRKQIAEAIDKYQTEHRLYVPATYDVTTLKGKESADRLTEEINKIVEKVNKDTDFYLICEMAKMYMQGVVPHYDVERDKGEWECARIGNINYITCSHCKEQFETENTLELWQSEYRFCHRCGADMRGNDNET